MAGRHQGEMIHLAADRAAHPPTPQPHWKTGQPSAIGEVALPEDVSNLEAVCASVCNLTNYAALGNASLPILLASLIAYITLSVSVW
jgi:hypothetical protein